jgi:hypothetical protein
LAASITIGVGFVLADPKMLVLLPAPDCENKGNPAIIEGGDSFYTGTTCDAVSCFSVTVVTGGADAGASGPFFLNNPSGEVSVMIGVTTDSFFVSGLAPNRLDCVLLLKNTLAKGDFSFDCS